MTNEELLNNLSVDNKTDFFVDNTNIFVQNGCWLKQKHKNKWEKYDEEFNQISDNDYDMYI